MPNYISLHCIAEAGDAKALSAMLVGQVDVDVVNRVSMELYRCIRVAFCSSHLDRRDSSNNGCLCIINICLSIDQNKLTALKIAAQEGHHECLSILLAHGAEVDKAEAVSVRGVCCIAYLLDVACIVVAAEGMRCNLSLPLLSIIDWLHSSHGCCSMGTP